MGLICADIVCFVFWAFVPEMGDQDYYLSAFLAKFGRLLDDYLCVVEEVVFREFF